MKPTGCGDHVFGYGSLVRHDGAAGVVCRLHEHRRAWSVAMDNRETIPGYKVYVERATGERPPVYVTFLDIRPVAGSSVNGVVTPVDAGTLVALDARERNYERRDVTRLIDLDLCGRVWAFVGRRDAHARYAAGIAAGTACVSRAYHDGVRAAFAGLGPEALEEFDRTTDAPEVPLRDLLRRDLPDAA